MDALQSVTPKSEPRNANSEVDTEQEEDLQGIAGPSSLSAQQQRRSSTRSIKRRKFDDELVESSLNMGGLTTTMGPIRTSGRNRFSISCEFS